MSADDRRTRLLHLLAAPAQDLQKDPFVQFRRKRHDVQREKRFPAHGVDIAHRVGGGDRPEGVGIVHDRSEEIQCADEGTLLVPGTNRRVIGRVEPDEYIGRHRIPECR